MLFAKKVHRTSLAFGAAGNFTIQLGHSLVTGNPFGYTQAVVAVGSYHAVVAAQGTHGTGGYSFLANIQVAEATYFLLSIQHTGTLFKAAQFYHQFIPV